MEKFSTTWNKSNKPKKQRKYRLKAPLHIKKKFVHTHLQKDLIKKYGKRSIGLRKGDKVRIIQGQFGKHQGKVDVIDIKKSKIFVSGVERTKKDGTKKQIPISPSNLIITELNLEDKFRQKKLSTK